MIIGLPKEIKDNENRVGLTPGAVRNLIRLGHTALVETGAGTGSSISDDEYEQAGAGIVPSAEEAWSADMVVKVKEPVEAEYDYLREEQLLFTYLHLAAEPSLAERLLHAKTTAVAYETVQTTDGRLPLLTPMSEVAGRMATQVGASYLQRNKGGRGVLLGGVPGVAPGRVAVLGGGVVGTNAAKIAVGMGAQVTVLELSHHRLQYLDDVFHGQIQTRTSNEANVEDTVFQADLVIGAVLIPGGRAPWLVTREMLSHMKSGSVIVDVSVDQGGCVETSHPTTHSAPTFVIDDVVHYCVANMPGAVPRTSTFALTNQTLPYILKLADRGLDAIRDSKPLQHGLNTHRGKLTHQAVAESFGVEYVDPMDALAA